MYYTFGEKLANFYEFYNGYECTEELWAETCMYLAADCTRLPVPIENSLSLEFCTGNDIVVICIEKHYVVLLKF